jgi:CBS domain containing-hemolysin-like protein
MNLLLDLAELAAVLLLTAGTAVFVAAEFSLTALERSQIEAYSRTHDDRRTKALLAAHGSLSFQLSGAQLGITLTTLVTGYLAEPAITDLVQPGLAGLGLPDGAADALAVLLAVLLATAVSMVYGELVPKNLAIARPLPTGRSVALLQVAFTSTFRWLITGLNSSANWVVRRLGVEPAEELRSARSSQELRSLLRASAERGTIDLGTATLLGRSLRFGERTADELMTPRVNVRALRADARVPELVELSRDSGFSRFPVYDGDLDEVLGVVHVKQVFSVPPDGWATTTVASLAVPAPTVPDSLDGDSLLERLRGSGLQLAIVVDEYGGTAGMVTLEDLVEEIVGDVRDEHDAQDAQPVSRTGERRWAVSGLLREHEVRDATGFRMPEGEYETVAGLMLDRLGHLPDSGETVDVDGWRLTVLRMQRHRIAELRLERLDDPDGDGGGDGEAAAATAAGAQPPAGEHG